jgi:hypothetical protein
MRAHDRSWNIHGRRSGSGVVVHFEFEGMGAESNRIDFAFPLPAEPRFDEVGGEDVSLGEELVIGFEFVEGFGQSDPGVFLVWANSSGLIS